MAPLLLEEVFSTFISFIFPKQIKPTCFIGIICYYKGNKLNLFTFIY
ncbi:hypothetical protein BCE_0613 [Bacillus cereus ATCC 10987]|uniref:Uncharacterized protein n=1 Tax=Bacillus cereus (strain ATCC 10987 / NRS 248) TaxID=222523 RepID=Q73DU8_BACC1|nr:hypothetical protein BCE_0613 [Bacillus cereus ATCC 10987]